MLFLKQCNTAELMIAKKWDISSSKTELYEIVETQYNMESHMNSKAKWKESSE